MSDLQPATRGGRPGEPDVGDATVSELADVRSVHERYQRPGPHTTVVMPIPTPGDPRNDLTVRWHATRNDLAHRGAREASLQRLDELISAIEPRGRMALLTADDESAAWCWLARTPTPELLRVDTLPALLPALAEAAHRGPILGAVIDRVGADVVGIEHLELTSLSTVIGEEEHVHRGAPGGWSQARYQRHSELVWERNAALVATELAARAEVLGTDLVVITGDERATALVAEQLTAHPELRVRRVEAGGRHEPGSPSRLHEAALAERQSDIEARHAELLTRLAEELGQNDLATSGAVKTLEAIATDRVGTLFVDLDHALGTSVEAGESDAIARAALDHGAEVVVTSKLDVLDGIAALLRFPYPTRPVE